MEWGKYSEESFYATVGRQPSASTQSSGQQSADFGQAGQSKKGRRREAASRKEQQQAQPQKSGEVDMAEAKQRLKVHYLGSALNLFQSHDVRPGRTTCA